MIVKPYVGDVGWTLKYDFENPVEIYLSLDENQSTGYRWEIESVLDDRFVVTYAHETIDKYSDDGDLYIGGGGKAVFTFTYDIKTVESSDGVFKINFLYRRPFDDIENEDSMIYRYTMVAIASRVSVKKSFMNSIKGFFKGYSNE